MFDTNDESDYDFIFHVNKSVWAKILIEKKKQTKIPISFIRRFYSFEKRKLKQCQKQQEIPFLLTISKRLFGAPKINQNLKFVWF